MTKYYKVSEKKIIETLQEIPVEMLEKKGLLQIENTEDTYEEGSTVFKVDSAKIVDDSYIIHKNTFYHVNTLEEEKSDKSGLLKMYITPLFPPLYKQVNVLLGECDETESLAIRKSVTDLLQHQKDIEVLILAATTIEEVQAIDITIQNEIEDTKVIS